MDTYETSDERSNYNIVSFNAPQDVLNRIQGVNRYPTAAVGGVGYVGLPVGLAGRLSGIQTPGPDIMSLVTKINKN